jgi:2-polyprenyl-6-methoxyphenol hydroxylase-like FAD-dependent oxidoreductase
MKLDKKIVIIGGGIGGLAMANALQQAGFEYDLYEQAPELTDVGAGIGLSGSAMEVLDSLGLGDDVRDTGIAIKNVYLANKHLKIRRKMDVQQETACIHRALLIDILKDRLRAERIHLSKQATDIKSHQDHTEVIFSDGSSVRSQCLIAADGIHSVIRKKLYPDIKVRYINQTIWRGMTRLEAPDAMKNSYFEIWDEGLRFLTVPYRQDKVMNIVKNSRQFGKAAHSRNPFLHYLYRFLLEYAPKSLLRIQERKLNDLRYLKELYE